VVLYSIPQDRTSSRTSFDSDFLSAEMIPLSRMKRIVAALVLGFSAILIFLAIDGLTMPMQLTLAVFVATITAWSVLDLPDTPVALAGAVALTLFNAIEEDALYRSLGNDIVWLMLSAFVVAGVLKHCGLIELFVARLMPRVNSVQGIFWVLTLLIFATAFVIPSTSARAAILMPIFAGLCTKIGNSAVTKALGLLFPSIILLSAGASLMGAGAHLVAVDFIARGNGPVPDFLDWLVLAGPFSLLCCLTACAVLLHFFLSAEERKLPLGAVQSTASKAPLSKQQGIVLSIVVIMVLLFGTTSFHGVGMPLIGIAAALILSIERLSGLSLKAALKSVEWNLLLFLAATLVIGEALIETGTAELLADRMVGLVGDGFGEQPALVIGFAILVATLSHLVVTSRTARAAVLIPAVALPLAALGVNPANLILAVTLASGFCQTLMVSAKPVALFGNMSPPAFNQADLLRLALLLLGPFVILLLGFSTLVWPLQGLPFR